jgi:GntR family transcriptional regulator / MocR family aminotransferase
MSQIDAPLRKDAQFPDSGHCTRPTTLSVRRAMPRNSCATILAFVQVQRPSTVTVGNQIYRSLRDAIENGVLRSGFRLPSSRELARQTGVARNTVQEVYRRLIVEGYLRGRSGSGTFVATPAAASRPSDSRLKLSRWAAARLMVVSRPLSQPFDITSAASDEFSWRRWMQLVSSGWSGGPHRQEPLGLDAARMAVAEHAAAVAGISCNAGDVVIGRSAGRMLMTIARVLADPGDLVMIDDSADRDVPFLFELADLRCVSAEADRDGIDVETVQDSDCRLIYVRRELNAGRRYALMAWAKTRPTPVIEDDFDAIVDPRPGSFKALKTLDTRGVCIYLANLGRTLMPGVPISFAVAPAPVVDALRVLPPSPPAAGEQLALAAYMRSGEFTRQIGRMRGVYGARREALVEQLTVQLSGAIISIEHRGPLHVIARLSPHLDAMEVAATARLLDLDVVASRSEQGLLVGYGGMPVERMPEAVARLAAAFETRDGALTA